MRQNNRIHTWSKRSLAQISGSAKSGSIFNGIVGVLGEREDARRHKSGMCSIGGRCKLIFGELAGSAEIRGAGFLFVS